MHTVLKLAAFAACALLAACQTPAIPYDRAADIKTIGVLPVRVPQRATVFVAATPGRSFGLIGALVDAGIQSNREDRLAKATAGLNFQGQTKFDEYLTAGLQAQSYTVKPIDLGTGRTSFLKTYPDGKADGVDAYLDILGVDFGYLAAGISDSSPYRPFMWVRCQLVRASDGSILMQDVVQYNPLDMGYGVQKGIVTVAPDPQYSFPDITALEAQPDKAVAGMDAALKGTADTVAKLLK